MFVTARLLATGNWFSRRYHDAQWKLLPLHELRINQWMFVRK